MEVSVEGVVSSFAADVFLVAGSRIILIGFPNQARSLHWICVCVPLTEKVNIGQSNMGHHFRYYSVRW